MQKCELKSPVSIILIKDFVNKETSLLERLDLSFNKFSKIDLNLPFE